MMGAKLTIGEETMFMFLFSSEYLIALSKGWEGKKRLRLVWSCVASFSLGEANPSSASSFSFYKQVPVLSPCSYG